MPTSRAVVDALRPLRWHPGPAATCRAGQRLGRSAGPDHVCGKDDNDRVAPAIAPPTRRGRHADCRPAAHRRPASPRPSLNEVKKAVVSQLDGEAGWEVVSVNQNGADVDVLNEVPAGNRRPRSPITPGPGRAGRRAARGRRAGPARRCSSFIKPSTGRDPGRRAERGCRRRRTDGDHGPVSARARRSRSSPPVPPIDRDMATPNTLLGCPGEAEIGHRIVPELQQVRPRHRPDGPRHSRISCNTTFAELASRMPPRALSRQPPSTASGPTTLIDGPADGDRFGAADGGPRRAHRGRLRPGQGVERIRSGWRWRPPPSRRARPRCRI